MRDRLCRHHDAVTRGSCYFRASPWRRSGPPAQRGAGRSQSAVTASPTITSRAMMTRMGVILGTAAYMSPEQAKGRAVDKRSDIGAFGCVLYEMLTGRRAFEGEDVSDTLAAVLRGEPDWTALPANASPALVTLLHGCLEKDLRRRIILVQNWSEELKRATSTK